MAHEVLIKALTRKGGDAVNEKLEGMYFHSIDDATGWWSGRLACYMRLMVAISSSVRLTAQGARSIASLLMCAICLDGCFTKDRKRRHCMKDGTASRNK